MLIYKSGDILEATENIICHQVNVDGIMGGGLALQIAKSYPEVEKKYKDYCNFLSNDYELLKDDYCIVKIKPNQYVTNCFTQKPNFDTDYDSLKKCFEVLLSVCKRHNKTICIPYKYGCGIANGDWNAVKKIFENLSDKFRVDIVVYKL